VRDGSAQPLANCRLPWWPAQSSERGTDVGKDNCR
jgi:hypothetical protein